METIFIFFKGFKKEEAELIFRECANLFDDAQLKEIPVTDEMLSETVGSTLEKLIKGESPKGNPVLKGHKTVIMALSEQEKAVRFMRKVKSLSPDFKDTAFAMLTSTALGWTFTHYLEHLQEEHQEMKESYRTHHKRFQ